jgi:RNA polymerase sigma-70 factor, ECF subfamily
MPTPSIETLRLVERATRGDQGALGELMEQYRDHLRRMVSLRLDPRLQGRVASSDVIQEGYLDAAVRLEEYARDPAVPFVIWLRFLVGQRILKAHRRHLGVKVRDVGREVSLDRGSMPGANTVRPSAEH